jgi:predicted branched-subunit amino acid permease
MSAVVFAGAAQFIAAQLLHSGAPAAVVILTIAVVNLRHVLYSASVAPYVERLPLRWRSWLAYLLTDEAYAVAILHYETSGTPTGHWFFWGRCSPHLQLSTALGIFRTTVPAAGPRFRQL